ncbi:hypothetical protein [Leekyejoonella antrihumi]|uniref:Uncharacterized protein n=1 Tax=Leekyejoonella antrihumi TaxID=1660198 RepID=A0A563E769_9MICO|nr:hypothetical protein [Leekyejoonella antrihumi]TWP37684.1 hypothetical protein FGL98_05635 [Leekyejoonella antrihumi]
MSSLKLADDESRSDLTTYVARARQARPDGAIRLQAVGTTLAAWVGVLDGRGLLGEGTTIGLRTLALREESTVDVTVPLAAVADRLARADVEPDLDIPPQTVAAAWAALTPPRTGWQSVTQVSIEALRSAASQGIEEITQGAPEGSGSAAVATLRWRVWTRPLPTSLGAEGLPSSVAFAVHALGFGVGTVAQVHRAASWHRVSTPAGFVLAR